MDNYTEKSVTNKNNNDTCFVFPELSNPMKAVTSSAKLNLSNYTQEVSRPNYDNDCITLISEANLVNNMIPQKLPVYNFNTEELNGERYYRPDGTFLLVREYDSDVIRDYYVKATDTTKIERILEHDKNTGRLKVKIEPVTREGSIIKSNITLFDENINKKYFLIQLTQDGTVNNITEFSANGKDFKTVYRGNNNANVAKYISGKETKEEGFVMLDCIFDSDGKVARIKRFSKRQSKTINYDGNKKSINVYNNP